MLNINGTEYYTKDELAECYSKVEHVIVICAHGWIFEGNMVEDDFLVNAHVVRKWSNGMGIGGLQSIAHKDEYTLDELPSGIKLVKSAVLAVLPITEW